MWNVTGVTKQVKKGLQLLEMLFFSSVNPLTQSSYIRQTGKRGKKHTLTWICSVHKESMFGNWFHNYLAKVRKKEIFNCLCVPEML